MLMGLRKISATLLGLMVLTLGLASMSAPSEALTRPEGEEHPEMMPRGFFLQPDQMSVDLAKYNNIDPGHIVPTRPLQQALKYFDLNKGNIPNQRFITIIEFSINSAQKRMYVIDMKSGAVQTFWVAHGRGSDPQDTGFATHFSNRSNSDMSSIGFALSGSLYQGEHGTSMYLHGLESTNSKIYDRAIVMHGAAYVYPGHAGRSLGCPAIELKYIHTLLPAIQGGSLIYMHYDQ